MNGLLECIYVPGAFRGQKWALDFLKLELKE